MQFANKKRKKKGGGGEANDAGLALLTQLGNDEEVADLKNSIKGLLDKASKLEAVLERAAKERERSRRGCVCG